MPRPVARGVGSVSPRMSSVSGRRSVSRHRSARKAARSCPATGAHAKLRKPRPHAMRVPKSSACRAPFPVPRHPPAPGHQAACYEAVGDHCGVGSLPWLFERKDAAWRSPSTLDLPNVGHASKTLAPEPAPETLAVSGREWACGGHTVNTVGTPKAMATPPAIRGRNSGLLMGHSLPFGSTPFGHRRAAGPPEREETPVRPASSGSRRPGPTRSEGQRHPPG